MFPAGNKAKMPFVGNHATKQIIFIIITLLNPLLRNVVKWSDTL